MPLRALSEFLSGSTKKHADSNELDVSHLRSNAGVIADEPSDSFMNWDWRADASRSPSQELRAPSSTLGAPLSARKKKDYYAGSAEIATETPLTVTRLEPVCSTRNLLTFP